MPSNSKTIEDLQKLVQNFCEVRNWDEFHSLKNLAIGTVTEAAELVEPFRFRTDAESADFFATVDGRQAVEDELADVLFFLLRISQLNRVDLAGALERKLVKNAKKYPAP